MLCIVKAERLVVHDICPDELHHVRTVTDIQSTSAMLFSACPQRSTVLVSTLVCDGTLAVTDERSKSHPGMYAGSETVIDIAFPPAYNAAAPGAAGEIYLQCPQRSHLLYVHVSCPLRMTNTTMPIGLPSVH